jgi:hypothetical protein
MDSRFRDDGVWMPALAGMAMLRFSTFLEVIDNEPELFGTTLAQKHLYSFKIGFNTLGINAS